MIKKCTYCKKMINTNDMDENLCPRCKTWLSTKLQMGNKYMIYMFRGTYQFLSNFYNCPVEFEGLMYKNSEAAFQSAKSTNIEIRKEFQKLSCEKAKKLGKCIPLRKDWEKVKIKIMYSIVKDKFIRNKKLGLMLLKTKDKILVEGNYWKDDFWGVCSKNGKNVLGRILMIVRDELDENPELLKEKK